MFHLSPATLLVLLVLALFIFGPDRLPKAVGEAARTLRKLRSAVRGATEEFREELGPEFRDVRLRDLHPRTLIQRHLLEEGEGGSGSGVGGGVAGSAGGAGAGTAVAARPAVPRPAPEGWPAHVPFPSAEEMGLGPDDDPFTAPIPRGKTLPGPSPSAAPKPSEPLSALPEQPEQPSEEAAEPGEPRPRGGVGPNA